MTKRRRSLLAFEQWLETEIERAKTELHGLAFERDEVARKTEREQVRLATLEAVAARLREAPVVVETDADVLPVFETEAAVTG
jgi:hypothetical protein